ncbi:PREDICTED: reverse mRNAase [Prunus dulcis]|uniref:PREDICTED: reverse mRNAase n=1 Tax=Prunus dulcis TaxID=3755 RepID=A0A5E4GBC8_PRUDU|nr:PREDICTED: reverse mRNAase [Prunus dulcis]
MNGFLFSSSEWRSYGYDTRGLRQRDPLSPYLFLICAEGLSALLTNGLRLKRIKRVSAAQGAPILSNLFFADDSILFCNAHLSDVSNLLQILRVYEQASGQIINFDKSAACFNPKTDPITKQLISDMLGVRIVASHERYMGLPTLTQRNKNKMFNHVRDMLWQKLSTWNLKLLSAVDYHRTCVMSRMQCSHVTGGEGQEAEAYIGQGGRNYANLSVWEELVSKTLKLSIKLWWRILEHLISLVGRMLKARYFPNGDFMQAIVGSSPSMIWKAIMWGREVVDDQLVWRVGSGRSIHVFKDRWIPKPFTFYPIQNGGLASTTWVSDLITPFRGWNQALLATCFHEDDREAIFKIALGAVAHMEDGKCWYFAKNKQLKLVTLRRERRSRKIVNSPAYTRCGVGSEDSGHLAAKELSHDDLDRPAGLDVIGTGLPAIREGLLLMRATGISRFVIASDSKEAVSMLKERNTW